MNKIFEKIKLFFSKIMEKNNNEEHYYDISYEIDGKNIKIISTNGEIRYIKNTKSNVTKVKKQIQKSIDEIKLKIDGYEENEKERLLVLLCNIACVVLSGILAPFTFFMGYIQLFIASIGVFSFCVLSTSFISIKYYFFILNIRKLKKLIDYKNDLEFNFKARIRFNK